MLNQNPIADLPSHITEMDLAYAAGFIDADGTIMIGRYNRKDRKGVLKVLHSPRISAGSIDRRPLDELQNLFGGTVLPQRRTKKDERGVQNKFLFWTWNINGSRAIEVASFLHPYLKIKGVQAYIVMCFVYEELWRKSESFSAMPKEEFERREKLTDSIRSFNQREYLEQLPVLV